MAGQFVAIQATPNVFGFLLFFSLLSLPILMLLHSIHGDSCLIYWWIYFESLSLAYLKIASLFCFLALDVRNISCFLFFIGSYSVRKNWRLMVMFLLFYFWPAMRMHTSFSVEEVQQKKFSRLTVDLRLFKKKRYKICAFSIRPWGAKYVGLSICNVRVIHALCEVKSCKKIYIYPKIETEKREERKNGSGASNESTWIITSVKEVNHFFFFAFYDDKPTPPNSSLKKKLHKQKYNAHYRLYPICSSCYLFHFYSSNTQPFFFFFRIKN